MPSGMVLPPGDHGWDEAVFLEGREILRVDQVEPHRAEARRLAAHAVKIQPGFGKTAARDALFQAPFARHLLGHCAGGERSERRGSGENSTCHALNNSTSP